MLLLGIKGSGGKFLYDVMISEEFSINFPHANHRKHPKREGIANDFHRYHLSQL
jgi:hypothetical protein